MRRVTIVLATTFALLAGLPAAAAPGELDLSFSGDGLAFTPRGRFVVGGFVSNGTTTRIALARLVLSGHGGVMDPTFGEGDGVTVVDVSGGTDAGHDVALQPNGRIVAVGETWVDRTPRFLVTRLRSR